MALDITINDWHDVPIKRVPLYLDPYNFIILKLDNVDGYPLLKKLLEDYYGEEQQVWLNQLDDLKKEVKDFERSYGSSFADYTRKFFDEFSELIQFAIDTNNTIKFYPD